MPIFLSGNRPLSHHCMSQWLYYQYNQCVSLFVHTDAPGANVTQDAGILVLTILISSILIYNSQNVPYKKDLEKLEYVYLFCFVQKYSKHRAITFSFTDNYFCIYKQVFHFPKYARMLVIHGSATERLTYCKIYTKNENFAYLGICITSE